jgi:hypothetical protein
MYPALLLPLALAAAPARPAAAHANDPPIQIWINNDRRFFPGERAKVQVRTDDDGYLIVLHADPDGNLRVLFPLDPRDDNFVRGGRKYEIRGRGNRESFDVDNRSGRGTVYAAVSRMAFRFDDFVLGDHWDYRTLGPNRLPRDPESELTDLVRRMAQGSFDYDVLSYDVIERVYAAGSYYDRPYYGSVYYGDTWCCSGVSVGLFFGSPYYRRHYYGPYGYYDPFYDPFFYDPFYYRPYYYNPVYWYPRPYRYYNYGYYHPRYYRDSRFYPRYNNWWDGTYRSRGFQTVNTDYRAGRYTFRRAVNTVYTPPIGRFAVPERSSPLRRTVDRREADHVAPAEKERTVTPRRATPAEPRKDAPPRDRGAEPRRTTRTESARPAPSVDRRRIETPGSVEARRAREPEPSRGVAEDGRDRATWPVDVTLRRSGDRPEARRAQPSSDEPRPEARPSRPAEDRAAPAQRAEPRSYESDRGRSDPPSRSSGDHDGGRRSSGGTWGGDGGGRSDAGRSDGGGRGGSGGSGGGRRR